MRKLALTASEYRTLTDCVSDRISCRYSIGPTPLRAVQYALRLSAPSGDSNSIFSSCPFVMEGTPDVTYCQSTDWELTTLTSGARIASVTHWVAPVAPVLSDVM